MLDELLVLEELLDEDDEDGDDDEELLEDFADEEGVVDVVVVELVLWAWDVVRAWLAWLEAAEVAGWEAGLGATVTAATNTTSVQSCRVDAV